MFPAGTSLSTAKAMALKEFPPGATYDRADDNSERCLILRVHSPRVEDVLNGNQPEVAFYSEGVGPLRPNDVNFAMLDPVIDYGKAYTDIGPC